MYNLSARWGMSQPRKPFLLFCRIFLHMKHTFPSFVHSFTTPSFWCVSIKHWKLFVVMKVNTDKNDNKGLLGAIPESVQDFSTLAKKRAKKINCLAWCLTWKSLRLNSYFSSLRFSFWGFRDCNLGVCRFRVCGFIGLEFGIHECRAC